MKKFLKEFKTFVTRGNVLDMACGVIVGGAFNAIVTSLNKQVLMPVINLGVNSITGGKGLYTILPDSRLATPNDILAGVATVLGPDGVTYTKLNYINWSAFFESIFNFFFIALTLFIIIKVVNMLGEKRKKLEKIIKDKFDKDDDEEEEIVPLEEPVKAPTEMDVLSEIRDLLKENKKED